MSDSFIQLQTDGSGKKVETEQVVDSLGNVVERQVVSIGDDALLVVLELLTRIADRLPRVDAFDRVITSGAEVTQAVSGTLTAVTTVNNVTDAVRLNSLGLSATTARPADAIPIHASNIGALHLYNQITVS